MRLETRALAIQDETLKVLIRELGDECGRVLELIHQLQFSGLQDAQKADILAELILSVIHLSNHCSDDIQVYLANDLEDLPDSEE